MQCAMVATIEGCLPRDRDPSDIRRGIPSRGISRRGGHQGTTGWLERKDFGEEILFSIPALHSRRVDYQKMAPGLRSVFNPWLVGRMAAASYILPFFMQNMTISREHEITEITNISRSNKFQWWD